MEERKTQKMKVFRKEQRERKEREVNPYKPPEDNKNMVRLIAYMINRYSSGHSGNVYCSFVKLIMIRNFQEESLNNIRFKTN